MVAGFDVEQLFDKKPLESEEEERSNQYFSPMPLETIPEREISEVNIGEAHQQALSPDRNSKDIPYSELFGRKIDPKERIDTDQSPFDFFDSQRYNEPTARELDTFTEAEKLPLEQKRLPPITKKEIETQKPTQPQEEEEYFREDRAEYDEIEEEESVIDNSFLSKLSGLKADVLNENRNSVGVGMFYQTRVGSAGLDALDSFVLPSLDVHYYGGLSHHFYGHANFINMSNGQITGEALQRYGDMKSAGNSESVSSLMELMGGYEYKGDGVILTAEVGTVPEPTISPESPMTWLFKISGVSGKFAYDLAYVNRSIKDSMLSRVGDTYSWVDTNGEDDPDTDENETYRSGTGVRGGVSKTGVEIEAKLSVDDEVFAGNLNYYYNISGYNVVGNEEISLTLLYLRLLDLPKFDTFMVGPIFLYDSYTYNSGYFTMGRDGMGNGGYFSPKNFILLGLYFDVAQIVNEKLFWKVKGNLGLMTFTSGKDIFDDTSTESEISGFGYEGKAFVGYKVDDSVQVLGGLGYQSSGTYQSLFFGLTAIYYFGEKKSNSIRDLMYSNTIGEMAK